jgi:hypothetical protein
MNRIVMKPRDWTQDALPARVFLDGVIMRDVLQAKAVAKIEQALMMISTGLTHRDRQIRNSILSELAGTTAPAELRTKPPELLEAVAETIILLGRRLSDGISYDSLLQLQEEARRLFDRIRMTVES